MDDFYYEWDEKKRLSNIEKHGLDFLDAPIVFGDAYLKGKARTVDGEERFIAIGILDDIHVTVIYTLRGTTIRLISFRRARHGERKQHQEVFGR